MFHLLYFFLVSNCSSTIYETNLRESGNLNYDLFSSAYIVFELQVFLINVIKC